MNNIKIIKSQKGIKVITTNGQKKLESKSNFISSFNDEQRLLVLKDILNPWVDRI